MADLKADAAALFDPQAQAALVEARNKANNSTDQQDVNAEQVRRNAEKKLTEKLSELKKSQIEAPQKESFARDDGVQKRFQEAMDGRLGPEAQSSSLGWSNSSNLQQKLTDAQKRMFQEAMANDTPRATQAGQVLSRMAEQPGFSQAVNTSQQMGAVQQEILRNPSMEKPLTDVLQSRFMQSKNADSAAKGDFMRFGMQQMGRGNMQSVKVAGDMLGVLTRTNTPRLAQRDAMNMAQRNPENTKGMRNVDNFAQQPDVMQLPTFARGKAVSLLAKADGAPEVKEGFEKLAGDPTFKGQTRDVKGRFFSTIGSGRPSEFRAMTDKSLQALQSDDFPARQAQVSRFLNKMGAQVSARGAAGVNVKQLLKSSKGSPLPAAPRLMSTEGLSDEDATKVRSQNRAKVIQYYTQVGRSYDQVDKRLGGAKYFEDVNVLPNLRDAEEVDTSMLSPEDKALVEGKSKQLKGRYQGLKKTQQQRMRELRTSRISPQQRRLQERRNRAVGQQSRYFSPSSARQEAGMGRGAPTFPTAGQGQAAGTRTQSAAMPQGQGLPPNPAATNPNLARTPMQGQRGSRSAAARAQAAYSGGSDELDADDVLSQLPPGLTQAQRMKMAKQIMAKQWQAQMEEVMGKLLGDDDGMMVDDQAGGNAAEAAPEGQQRSGSVGPQARGTSSAAVRRAVTDADNAAPGKRGVQGKTDGWGIQRTFERDLGGTQRGVVKAPTVTAGDVDVGEPSYEQLATERYTGRSIVRPSTQVRDASSLFSQESWKSLTKAETALMKNLGWNQQTWDSKLEPAARWPASMRTRFGKLGATQRESVRKLGLSADDWDAYVASLGGAAPAA